MPAPIVPLALGAGLALWTLYEQQKAKEKQGAPATTPVTSLPPVPLMPGAAPYLPPVAAPEPIRNLMANAIFSKNPVALRTAAKNIRALGYPDLATILESLATQLEQPTKAVAGAWFGDHAGHHRAAMLGVHRRRARVGDDFEMLAAAAGVSGDDLLARRRAFLRRVRVSGALGDGPPIYVGGTHAHRRAQLLRRLRGM
jgi:hypothetical protein